MDLPEFIGEEKPELSSLVTSDPNNEAYQRGSWGPSQKRPKNVPVIQEIGEYLVNCLHGRTRPFQGRWLVWKGKRAELQEGRLEFSVQRRWIDTYRRCPTVIIVLRPAKEPLWPRICCFFKSIRALFSPRDI